LFSWNWMESFKKLIALFSNIPNWSFSSRFQLQGLITVKYIRSMFVFYHCFPSSCCSSSKQKQILFTETRVLEFYGELVEILLLLFLFEIQVDFPSWSVQYAVLQAFLLPRHGDGWRPGRHWRACRCSFPDQPVSLSLWSRYSKLLIPHWAFLLKLSPWCQSPPVWCQTRTWHTQYNHFRHLEGFLVFGSWAKEIKIRTFWV